MSIMIMSRVFRMNLGGCNRKLLAVRLADFADDEGRGIYPGVKRLANETELSERTIQRIMADFVADGILVVVQEASGRPGQATRYDFNLEKLFAYRPKTGDTVSPVGEKQTGDTSAETGDTGDRDGCHRDTRTVIEPLTEPSLEREARERATNSGSVLEEDRKAVLREFRRWYPTWPGYVDSKDSLAERAWLALTAEERAQAVELSQAYCEARKQIGRTIPISAQVYLAEKRWTKIEAMKADSKAGAEKPAKAANGRVAVGVFGPAFGAAHALALLEGPVHFELPADLRSRVAATYEVHARRGAMSATSYRDRLGLGLDSAGKLIFPEDFEAQERRRRLVSQGFPEANRLNEAAKERSHVTVDARFEALKDLMEFVPLGSVIWDAWMAEYERRGWPVMPAPAAMKGAYFPAGGPEALDEFDRAARARLETRTGDDAA